MLKPRLVVWSEKPYPGMEGTTTSKASAGSPPWLVGSVSSGMTFDISKMVLGQPWVMMRGSGVGPLAPLMNEVNTHAVKGGAKGREAVQRGLLAPPVKLGAPVVDQLLEIG